MTEVADRRNAKLLQFREGHIAERPIVLLRTEMAPVIIRPETEILEFLIVPNQLKIVLPALVEAALGHLIDALILAIAACDNGIAAFDSGSEHEPARVVIVRF